MLEETHPEICFISEANLFKDKPDHLCRIEGYNLTRAKTMDHLGYSRIVLLTKEGLNFSLEDGRMENDISTIWIKVGGKGRKGVLVCGTYREHKIIRQPEPNLSSNPDRQQERWSRIIEQWKNASDTGNNVIVIGDMNVDLEKWDDPEQLVEPMVDLLKEEIITRNFFQMVQGPTWHWKDRTPSLIDQCWVNDPGRVTNVRNTVRSTADHNMISICFKMAGKVTSPLENVSRDWNKLEENELKRRMSLVNWELVFKSDNLDVANWEFQSKFLEILNNLAPMRRTQSRAKVTKWVSAETKEEDDSKR